MCVPVVIIITFCWISGSREYSEDSLKSACDYQAELDASFGGTEILEALQAIYNKPLISTHSRQVNLFNLILNLLHKRVTYHFFINLFNLIV